MAASIRDTDALVLDCTDHGESDLILTLFCRDVGRLHAIAKGAKKSRKRFVNKLEVFSFLHITYRQKAHGGLVLLAEADLHTPFLGLRRDAYLYGVATVLREYLLLAVRDNAPEAAIFRLSLWALHHLDQNWPPMAILALFLIRFYGYLGYRPAFSTCTGCGKPVTAGQRYGFEPQSGGVICGACRGHRPTWPLSPGTIKMLRSAQDLPLERLHRLKVAGGILREAIFFLESYGNQLFQREIVSWRVCRQLTLCQDGFGSAHAKEPSPLRLSI